MEIKEDNRFDTKITSVSCSICRARNENIVLIPVSFNPSIHVCNKAQIIGFLSLEIIYLVAGIYGSPINEANTL